MDLLRHDTHTMKLFGQNLENFRGSIHGANNVRDW